MNQESKGVKKGKRNMLRFNQPLFYEKRGKELPGIYIKALRTTECCMGGGVL